MSRIRITAIPKNPIDTRGVVATLVDMSRRLVKERTTDGPSEENQKPKGASRA